MPKERVIKLLKRTKLGKRYVEDADFRILLTSVLSFVFNMLFALYNQILGTVSNSLWFTVISGYYIILGAMRLGVVFSHRQSLAEAAPEKLIASKQSTRKFCGILLLALAFEFGATVYLSLTLDIATKYDKFIMISIAIYTAVRLFFAIKNMLRAHLRRSALHSMLRDISCADAAASVFTLIRSLTVSFDGFILPLALNIAVGGLVFLFVLFLAVNMLRRHGGKKE